MVNYKRGLGDLTLLEAILHFRIFKTHTMSSCFLCFVVEVEDNDFELPVSSTALHYYYCSAIKVFHCPETLSPNKGSLLDIALVMAVLSQ